MVAHFRSMADETGMPIIIYNVVPWSYLSPTLLTRIMNEVPLVIGVKQSAGDLKLFADLMMMAPDRLIFSAVDALMYPSYVLGAHGSIAAILTAAPHASVELWDAVKTGNHDRALDLHKKLLALWNALNADNLPACTRHAQTLQGLAKTYPRAPMPDASIAQQAAITSRRRNKLKATRKQANTDERLCRKDCRRHRRWDGYGPRTCTPTGRGGL
jgi:4-hydroxy-tetrahydrodipicolinate synthase